ncbi:MAG: hypothetical protein J3K34DRAFT_489529 [Monoraphidium minutum]|nr:MAG: hypothetical protein J3K34DRAFT_489529 [Monoraphidium minutum]
MARASARLLLWAALLAACAAARAAAADAGPAARTAPPPPVRDCLALAAAVAAFTADATAPGAARVVRTITLACGGDFNCYDAAAPRVARSVQLMVAGGGDLTLAAERRCARGRRRPRLYGGDAVPGAAPAGSIPDGSGVVPLIYVGTPLRGDEQLRGAGAASLTLDGVVLDGRRSLGDAADARLRGGLWAYYALQVTLRNSDVVSCTSSSPLGGGGLYLEESPLVMAGGRVEGCASGGDGGGILALAVVRDAPRLLRLTGGVAFLRNAAAGQGGAIAVGKAAAGPAGVACEPACSFVGNRAAACSVLHSERDDAAAAEDAPPPAAGEPAALVAAAPVTFDLGRSKFSGNVAANGLALCGQALPPFLPALGLAPPGKKARRGALPPGLKALGAGGRYNDFQVTVKLQPSCTRCKLQAQWAAAAAAAAAMAAPRLALLVLLAFAPGLALADAPTVVTAKSCHELVALVDANSGASRLTVLLACGADFDCYDPSAPPGSRSLQVRVTGARAVMLRAAKGCAAGAARPRLYGGDALDAAGGASLVYVGTAAGAPAPGAAASPPGADGGAPPADRDGASLVLENLILDGAMSTADANGEAAGGRRGGVYAWWARGVALSNVDVVNCASESAYGGGGLYSEESLVAIKGGAFRDNIAYGNGGAVLAVVDLKGKPFKLAGWLAMSGVGFVGNRAYGYGGAIAATKASELPAAVKCSRCSFARNRADADCSVFYSDREDTWEAGDGGGVRPGAPLSLTFTGAKFEGNTAGGRGLAFCGTAANCAPDGCAPGFVGSSPFGRAKGSPIKGLSRLPVPAGGFNDFALA